MVQLASVNYDTKRAYLHADMVSAGFDVIAAYFEANVLREANAAGEQNRAHFLSAEGNIQKTTTTFTPRYGYVEPGWRFVPYDTGAASSYNLDLLAEIVSKDQVTDRDVFDRSGLACTVNIDPIYEKVEIRVITTGGSALTTEEHDKLMALPAASATATAVLSAAQAAPVHADIQRVNGIYVGGSGTELDPWGPA